MRRAATDNSWQLPTTRTLLGLGYSDIRNYRTDILGRILVTQTPRGTSSRSDRHPYSDTYSLPGIWSDRLLFHHLHLQRPLCLGHNLTLPPPARTRTRWRGRQARRRCRRSWTGSGWTTSPWSTGSGTRTSR